MPVPTIVSSGFVLSTTNVLTQSLSLNAGTGTDRFILCGVSFHFGAEVTWTTAQYAGVNLTEDGRRSATDDAGLALGHYVYYITNPTSGTNNVTFTYSGTATSGWYVWGISFSGVDQTTPLRTSGWSLDGVGNAQSASDTISSASNDIGVQTLCKRNTAALTITGQSGQTSQIDDSAHSSGTMHFAMASVDPSVASLTMGYTWAGGVDMIHQVAGVRGLADPPGNPGAILVPAAIIPNTHHRQSRI